ncbi:MAG: hypothetical protein HY909_14020 [Deltaproteobacteria bacterium]|nr:hypothetical protein [Deltaproteobacteria bacterium]
MTLGGALRRWVYVAVLAGCGGEATNTGSTFECGGATVATRPRCATTTEYCEVTTTMTGGASMSTARCLAVPTGCAGPSSPCTCLMNMIDGGSVACASIAISGARQTTLSRSP